MRLMPDPIKVCVAYLKASPFITAAAPVTVSATLDGYAAGNRWVVVSVAGGTRHRLNLVDMPRMDLNCYAESKPAAHELAERAVTALLASPGYRTDEAVIRAADVLIRPVDLTDPIDYQPRFTASVQLWLSAA